MDQWMYSGSRQLLGCVWAKALFNGMNIYIWQTVPVIVSKEVKAWQNLYILVQDNFELGLAED